ncbi:ParB/RepB/Spo0J family partition protein [Kitasatospora sp. MAP5-34]|uniref:ParB/RepB/Spo0J family partition protein n=1 Tax=Kitasatospora sp. MAP5-34 TaxID=3035102 RepID=UPI002476B862|nr:ParB/RepB/Spo0J family partition protein [Kitasatospora sp. MAP5-34]
MRVIDGVHRLMAAHLRGDRSLDVTFVDDSEDNCFIRAVEANNAHGMPLSLADRKAAAARILRDRPEWSDRAVARIVALSPKTVAVVRQKPSEEIPQSTARIGRDGRKRAVRPPGASGRTAVDASAGLPSPQAHDPHTRCTDDDGDRGAPSHDWTPPEEFQPLPSGRTNVASAARASIEPSQGPRILKALARDPSLRLSETGRALVRKLAACSVAPEEVEGIAAAVPAHCARSVTQLALAYSRAWEELARTIQTASS